MSPTVDNNINMTPELGNRTKITDWIEDKAVDSARCMSSKYDDKVG